MMFKSIYATVLSIGIWLMPSVQSEPLKEQNVSANQQVNKIRESKMSIKDLPKPWQKLAWCESRYQRFAVSPSGEHHGYFQIHKGFFKAKKVNWRTATLEEQFRVAKYVYNRQGANAWSCAGYADLK